MEPRPIVGSPMSWARDFAILGGATGSMAPFLVIFDPVFALAGGLAGAFLGALLGMVLGGTVEVARQWMPLSVMTAGAAVVGSLWGAATGTIAGSAAFAAGSMFDQGAAVLGFVLGGCAGMVQLGWFFLPYLFGSVHGKTAPVLAAGVLAAPLMGWAGLAALMGSTFGLWLFALPLMLWAGTALDRRVERERLLETARKARLADGCRPRGFDLSAGPQVWTSRGGR